MHENTETHILQNFLLRSPQTMNVRDVLGNKGICWLSVIRFCSSAAQLELPYHSNESHCASRLGLVRMVIRLPAFQTVNTGMFH